MISQRDNPGYAYCNKITPMTTSASLPTPLRVLLNASDAPVLGILRVQGADAVPFLQGQLTQDVATLGMSEARLAAWCSAKGRMLASFVVFKLATDDFALVCSHDLVASTLKRLKMYVLRAKCVVSDVSAQYGLWGVTESAMHLGAAGALSIWPTARNESENGPEIRITLPAGQWLAAQGTVRVPRALVLQPGACAAQANAADIALWHYLEASSAIAPISAAVTEAYVPQMLNYESVGAVNFKKGCYPGQEVVARSQFRGTIKRRGYLVTSSAPIAAGFEVFDANDPSQPCGSVAFAASRSDSTSGQGMDGAPAPHLAIISLQTSAAQAARLVALPASPAPVSPPVSPLVSTGTAPATDLASAAVLTLVPLPYVLRDDI